MFVIKKSGIIFYDTHYKNVYRTVKSLSKHILIQTHLAYSNCAWIMNAEPFSGHSTEVRLQCEKKLKKLSFQFFCMETSILK